jgi:hypothetical protein
MLINDEDINLHLNITLLTEHKYIKIWKNTNSIKTINTRTTHKLYSQVLLNNNMELTEKLLERKVKLYTA